MDQQQFYAHSQPGKPEAQWHPLREHLVSVARHSSAFAAPLGLEQLANLASLLHDAGKYNPRFQRRLRDSRIKAPHSIVGSAIAYSNFRNSVLAFVCAGHHGGLDALSRLKEAVEEYLDLNPGQLEWIVDRWKKEVGGIPHLNDLEARFAHYRKEETEALIRFLFSCVVDADYLDTEAFLRPENTATRVLRPLSAGELFETLADHIQSIQSKAKEGPVKRVRSQVLEDCVNAAANPPGFFSLTAPTGSGKTLSSMAFAIEHAHLHNLKRIVVVIPYLSIIEQSAKIFRDALGDDIVVEHHSGVSCVERKEGKIGEKEEATSSAQLAAENWDAPIVVTTSVQFLESLFAHKPAKCRKLHNIAQSVVIFDEVQTIPPGLLEPTLSMFRFLVSRCNTSLVFCSATMPAWTKRTNAAIGLDDVREIAKDPCGYMRALKRTEYMWHKAPLSVAEVERRLRDTRQALVIVNTRKDALRLFESLSGEHVYHLSTSMCPRHRTDVLHKVKTRLDQGKPCLLVATQLVEAGVDIDFPCVYRALGPLDSIVQAGGRCNREGTQRAGKVQVFELEDGGLPPGGYGTATGVTRTMLEGEPEGLDVDSTAVFESYFTRLYTVTELDSGKVQQYRRDFNFPEVAKSYRLIGDDTIGVVTPHVQSLYDEASCVTQPDRDFFRKLQPTQISMYNHDLTEALREGAVFPREIDGGSIYLCRPDCYDQETGFRPAYLRGDQAVT